MTVAWLDRAAIWIFTAMSVLVVWFAYSGFNSDLRLLAIIAMVAILSTGMARLAWVLSGIPFYSDPSGTEEIPRVAATVFAGGGVVACYFLPQYLSGSFMVAALIVPLVACWIVATFRNRLRKLGHHLFVHALISPVWVLLCWIVGDELCRPEHSMEPNHPSAIAVSGCALLLFALAIAEGQRRLARTGLRTWKDYAVLVVVLIPIELVIVGYLLALVRLSGLMGGWMSVEGIFYVFTYVSDFERSKRFYGETLGFKLGTDEADVAGFAFGDAYLVIHRDNRPPDKAVYGGGMWLAAKVDDIGAEHVRLKEAGVEVGEVLDQPWGERQFYFEDPDGYHWSFGQAK